MLSTKAQKILDGYFNLPFDGIKGVRCPYFNNARLKQRAQLGVLIGKGTPKEIIEEAKIISIQYHAGLFDKTGHCCLHNQHTGKEVDSDEIRKFLIDHNLGVECSGFVTQILRAHFQETKKIDIAHKFFIVSPRHLFRLVISKLRPIENISVRRYCDDHNTKKIDWSNAQTGDVVVMMETGPNNKRNHILLITEMTSDTIHYAHARAWSSEGKYGHGVSMGKIKIIDKKSSILDQTWEEMGLINEKNETWQEAKDAKMLEIRRLNF